MPSTSIANVIIAFILVCFALDAGQAIFGPIVAAVVIGVVIAPVVDITERAGIRRSIAASFVLLFFLLIVAGLAMVIEPAVSSAIRNAPFIWQEIQSAVETLRRAFSDVQEMQETVTDALTDGESSENGDAEVRVPGVLDALSYGPSLFGGLMIFVGTLYFFLSSRDGMYRQLASLSVRCTATRLKKAERRVSRYFLTITMINAGLGTSVWLAMMLIGMPQPALWGLAAFLLNFVIYVGPAVMAVSLLIVGVVVFDGVFQIIPVILYLSLNLLEAQFVTPATVGMQMKLNPLLVFVSLVFWLWLWGPLGGIVAIPILVWSLYLFRKVPPTSSVNT